MESQNIEANKVGFSNWHYFLKNLKINLKVLKNIHLILPMKIKD